MVSGYWALNSVKVVPLLTSSMSWWKMSMGATVTFTP